MTDGSNGAQMGRVYPRAPTNNDLLRVSWGRNVAPIDLGTDTDTLENGQIIRVSDFDAFRPGQQIFFYLTVFNAVLPVTPGASYISRVKLKFWWLRTSDDFRAPGGPVPPTPGNPFGDPIWTPNDYSQFGGKTPNPYPPPPPPFPAPGSVTPVDGTNNNRAVWFPHPKMIDVSEWQSVNPPPAAAPRTCDSIIEDEVFVMDLQNPNTPSYQGIVIGNQIRLGRNSVFQLIAHGWALGLTHQFDVVEGQGQPPRLEIDLTWQTGTL